MVFDTGNPLIQNQPGNLKDELAGIRFGILPVKVAKVIFVNEGDIYLDRVFVLVGWPNETWKSSQSGPLADGLMFLRCGRNDGHATTGVLRVAGSNIPKEQGYRRRGSFAEVGRVVKSRPDGQMGAFPIDKRFDASFGGIRAFLGGLSGSASNLDGSAQETRLSMHQVSLPLDAQEGQSSNQDIHYCDVYDDPFRSSPLWGQLLGGGILGVAGILLVAWSGKRWTYNRSRWWDYLTGLCGLVLCCMGTTTVLFGHAWPPKQKPCEKYSQQQSLRHNDKNVTQKPLTRTVFL